MATAPSFLTFAHPAPPSYDVEINGSDFLTFTMPVSRTVLAGTQQRELLLVTPGGVPGLPGPAGAEGPEGPIGPPGDGSGEYLDAAMAAHVDHPTPHPAYDEGPDLILLYLNAKV